MVTKASGQIEHRAYCPKHRKHPVSLDVAAFLYAREHGAWATANAAHVAAQVPFLKWSFANCELCYFFFMLGWEEAGRLVNKLLKLFHPRHLYLSRRRSVPNVSPRGKHGGWPAGWQRPTARRPWTLKG